MPRQANGSYQAPAGTTAVSGQTITASAFNTLETDIGSEITNSLDRLGRGGMQAILDMGAFRITSLGNPTGAQDAVTLSYMTAISVWLGYTPANKAGDTFTGAMVFSAAATFSGTTTVLTTATNDSSTKAANTIVVDNKIAAQAALTPQVTVLTTGSGTYTKPAGAVRLAVEMIGGGSGGGGAGLTTTGGAGGIGGDTTFGASLTAQGGRATPTSGVYAYPAAATATGGDLNVPGALGGGIALNPNPAVMFGGAGAATAFGGGGPGATQFNGTSYTPAGAGASFGSGGGGGSANVGSIANIITGWGGNAGAFLKKSITSPSATYAYSVGVGGTAGTGGTDGSAGAVGAGGLIIVTAYFQ